MSLDLGDLASLATAIGLIDGDGDPVDSWFADPGLHLSRVLANPVQRNALVELVDELLGGSEAATDAAGVTWLPLVEVDGATFRLFLTLQEVGGGAAVRVGVGVRVRVAADDVSAEIDAHVPLFLAAGSTPVSDPLLLGKPGAPIEAALRLRLPPESAPGRVALAAVELAARVPTTGGEDPTVSLALRGLRMPGAAAPRDLIVDAANAAGLDDALLELIFGLVEALVDGLPAGSPLRGLAAMLGLADDAVPDFPVAQLAERGPQALAEWLAEALSGSAREDWLDGLALLLGGSVVGAGIPEAAVEVSVGGAPVRLELLLTPGAASRPVITPRLSAGVAGGHGARLALSVDLVSLDLGNGAAVAVPRLAVTGRIDPPGPARLLEPVVGPGGLQMAVGALEVGFGLDASRRPVLLITAENADIGATHYDLLDLSTPEALAAVAGQAVSDAAAALLGALGPAGDAVAILLGFEDPPGAAGLPRIAPGELLRDPLGAVRRRWQALLSAHAAEVPAVLAVLRDAIADEAVRAVAIGGTGAPATPWRIPLAPRVDLLLIAVGDELTLALEASLGGDLGETGISASFGLQAMVLTLNLATGGASFLPGMRGLLTLQGAGGERLRLGASEIVASLAALGLSVQWQPGAGLRALPALVDARLQLPSGEIALPALSFDSAGNLNLDAAGWRAIEQLAGALALETARRASSPWLAELATLVGWARGLQLPSVLSGSVSARLSLAALIADPEAALRGFVEGLLRDEEALRALLATVASALGTAPLDGRGAEAQPWSLPLAAATGALAGRLPGTLPGLILSLGQEGAAAAPTVVPPALRIWTPGTEGLEPDALAAALAGDANLDELLAELVAGRGDIGQGLTDLLDRWAATDGLATLPDSGLPSGVTGHRPADLLHGAPLDGPAMAELLAALWDEQFGGAAPATLVYVAIEGPDRKGAPAVLPAVDPARLIDLTAPDLPPEAFTPPAGPTGAEPWAIRLGSRAACRLPAGHAAGPDPDGVAGQAARLRRVLAALTGAGADIAVVAHGGAGHAAVRAASGLAGIKTVITVGTPWSPVAVDSLDALPSGEALRLLAALLRIVDGAAADPDDPAVEPDEPDDPDLALARGATAALLDLDPFADPLADLRPPGGPTGAGAIPVHAIVGSLAPQTLRRAMTATFAAALAARARARASELVGELLAPLRAGLRLPLQIGGAAGGVIATIAIEPELISIARETAEDAPALLGPGLRVRLELGAASGWLVGGPDPGRAGGAARLLACRRLTAVVELPLRGWVASLAAPPARARLILHEVRAFETERERWLIELGSGASPQATPLLPEVRAVLAEIAGRLTTAAAADPAIASLRVALASLGILGAGGGVDPVTLERLLLDPEATVAAARNDGARRAQLVAALRGLANDTRAAAAAGDTVQLRFGAADELVATLDLAAPALSLAAAGGTTLPWAIAATASAAGLAAQARLGPDLTSPTSAGVALALAASGAGLSAQLQQRGISGRLETLALWPAPDPTALLDALTDLVPGLALQALLDALRSSLISVAPTAASVVDALLDAAGLLGAAPAGDGVRPLRPVAPLVRDPVGWLQSQAGGIPGRVPALLDALRGLLGAAGGPGTLAIVDGVALRAGLAGPRLLVAVDLDATAFTPPVSGLELVLAGSLGLAVPTAGAGPTPDLSLTVGIASAGSARLRVGPDAGGAGDAVGVTLALVPTARPEIILFPGGPGLGGLADAAAAGAVAALPALLDALASNDPAGTPANAQQVAGRLVARLGDALALRTGSPARFDQAALVAFGNDPAAALAARGAALAAAGLTLLAEAVQPLIGSLPARAVSSADGALVVTVGAVTLRWRPGASRVEGAVALAGLPGIGSLAAELAVSPLGLALFELAIGPATLDADVLTLKPYGRVRVGAATLDGRLIEVGLGVGDDRRLAFRWDLSSGSAGLVAMQLGATPAEITELTAPAAIAATTVGAVLDLAGGVVLALGDVQAALAEPVLGTTVGALLEDVLLAPGQSDRLDPAIAGELSNPVLLLRRLGNLAANLAAAPGAAIPIEGVLTLRVVRRDEGTTPVFGVNISIDGSWELNPGSDVVVSLEEDATWIAPPAGTVPEGLTVEILDLPPSGPPTPRPGLVVGGLGVRIGRASGPLLDAGISVGSVAAHIFAGISSSGSSASLAGGVKLELAALGVGLAGASGGDNQVAQGIMGQAGTGEDAPAPRFSPALAVQKHQGQPVRISLFAGPGSGPWWLTIQRQFGPIYLEQVGLAVVNPPSGIESVGVLIDGGVSLLGLSASVDDLSLTYIVSGGGSALDPSRWRVDLAGFAVAADVSGITLAGGLRRFTPAEGGVEYLGMLMARVAVYGLSVYGGYGLVGPESDRYTAIFLFGAVNGPIGGPPAFFLTGIGGGFGINRRLSVPTDLSQFGTFPLIKALDPAARAGDPFRELAEARVFFAPERGSFWFAAGLSFTSFALVDGIAVVAVQIGGGFEFSLLGLARMALPRPQAPLVFIEMALVARFSTREGLILVQAQLTDNSWLLAPAVRLTGGFAFAAWFAGPNRGQFVVTLGGYHPDFHRDGYPIVPRLGLAWRIGSNISVTGESYFALTSEALMAGVRVEISARLGPAWAHVVFGGDGIVYFDPFWLKVTVYASIDAGVTIDLWLGEITISVHLSARIEVSAPPFHAIARFEVGPVGLTLEIGDRPSEPRSIPWDQFVRKYLEEASAGRARVLALVAGDGAVPPSGSATSGGDKSPDGTPDRPFRVVAEFELTITSTAPLLSLIAGGAERDLAASRVVSVAPMGLKNAVDIKLSLHMVGPPAASQDRIARLIATPQQLGAFPIGTWGAAPDPTNPSVPSGDVIAASDRVLVRGEATIPGARPGDTPPPAIPYRQVETGDRRLLPFVTESPARRAEVREAANELAGLIPSAESSVERLNVAAELLAERGGRSPADVAAWRGDRAAAPLFSSLAEGLGRAPRAVTVTDTAPPPPPAEAPLRPPRLRALLVAPETRASSLSPEGLPEPGGITTVAEALRNELRPLVVAPPSLAEIDGRLLGAVPTKLMRLGPIAGQADRTVVPAVAPPLTRTVLAGAEIAAGRGAEPASRQRVAAFERALLGKGDRIGRAAREQATLAAGELAVFELLDAARDRDKQRRPLLTLRSGRARVVALGPAGGVTADEVLALSASSRRAELAVPPATRGLIVIGLPAATGQRNRRALSTPPPVAGWSAAVPLPSATDGVLIAAGCVVDAMGRFPCRDVANLGAGWVAPEELVSGESAVTTTFAAPVAAVAVALDGGEGDDFALGVEGAHRPAGPDGTPEAPLLVADGPRSVLVYRLLDARPGTALTVTTGAARRLAGVAAILVEKGRDEAAALALAEAIGREGFAALIPPVAEPGPGGASIVWKEA